MSTGIRKRPGDPNGRHIRVYVSLLNSHAWRVLGWSARSLFVDLRAGLTGTNNGAIGAPLATLRHRDWTSSSALAAAIYELRALGFMAVTREGGLRQGTRVTTLYRFTDLEVFEQPRYAIEACKATHEYLKFDTLVAAKAALSEGVAQLRERGRAKQAAAKKTPVRKPNPIDSESEAERKFIGSDSEQGKDPSVRNSNREKSKPIASQAA